MNDFSTAAPRRNALSPNQRVNYSSGLMLGVDEFKQEQAYFLGRTRQHNRVLHGYGTVCGLDLTIDGSQVKVSSGLAIDPRGRVIPVINDQTGDINAWLSKADNQAIVGSNNKPYSLYVSLYYCESQTDPVPTPGEPGRAEDDTLEPARVTETFQLQFSPTRPAAQEEAAVRSFGDLLQRVKVTSSGAGPFLQPDGLVPYVRGLLLESPNPSALPGPTSSPLGGPLWVKSADAAEVLRQALQVWTTEIRPQLLPDEANSAGGAGSEDGITLGRVDFSITNAWKVDPAAQVTLDQGERPILLHTRLLQEWLLRAFSGQPASLLPSPQPTGNFVQYPTALPVFNIIAAGVLSAAAARKPLYDPGLKASVLGAGRLQITFRGYKIPDGTFIYIVKALAVCNEKVRDALALIAPVVNFDSFNAKGIVLSVFDNGKAIDPKALGKLEVMVEISSYKNA